MKEFDYYVDERSETIEKAIQDKNVDMFKLLNISEEEALK